MQPRSTAWCAACLAILWAATAAAGTVTYQYAFDRTSYLVAPGGTVGVSAYLVETVGAGGVSVLSSTGVGMSSAGVTVHFDGTPQPGDPAAIESTAAVAANAAFDQSAAVLSSGFASLAEYVVINDYVHGSQPNPPETIYRLPIGTFTFTAGSVSGESTPITATRHEPTSVDVNVTGAGATLDGLIAEMNATITTALRGDANLDGRVNGDDLNTVLSNYNQIGRDWAHGDFDGDGTVDGADLNAVLSNYNLSLGLEAAAAMDAGQFAGPFAAAVPEPSALVLGGIAALAVLAFRRWRRRR
jgi:hypothetical protein